MKLSICMMIKDEEKNLERCLNSLLPFKNKIETELIIVDTGSTDHSVEIAKKYTDKVYFHSWNNNFSEMRNISIGYAVGEWIFIIDADEELPICDSIIDFLCSNESKEFNSITVICKNIMNKQENKTVDLASNRFFRNNGHFKYEGSVHNMPVFMGPTKNTNTVLLHYGYNINDKETVERKFIRTSKLLINELEKEPNNVYYRYQLSVSYFTHHDNEKAYEECQKAYKTMKENKLDLVQNFYIFPHYVKCLIALKDFEKAKTICEEGIKIHKEHFDLYFFLGEVSMQLSEYAYAEHCFSNYLSLLERYQDLSIANDTNLYFETIDYKESAYQNLAIIYYNNENFSEVIKISKNITNINVIKENIPLIIGSFLRLESNNDLLEYYQGAILSDDRLVEFFAEFFEKIIEKNSHKDMVFLYKILSTGNHIYSMLNKVRCIITEDEVKVNSEIINFINRLNFEVLPSYYGDLIYYKLIYSEDIYQHFCSMNDEKIIQIFVYLAHKNIDFINKSERYLEKYINTNGFIYTRCNRIILKVLLATGEYANSKYEEIFNLYLENGIKYVKYIYSEELLTNGWFSDILSKEDIFLILIYKANKIKEVDNIEYINYLKRAVQVFPEMSKGIGFIVDKFSKIFETEQDEFECYKLQVKENILLLIEEQKYGEALKIIDEYEKIIPNDLEILNYKTYIHKNYSIS